MSEPNYRALDNYLAPADAVDKSDERGGNVYKYKPGQVWMREDGNFRWLSLIQPDGCAATLMLWNDGRIADIQPSGLSSPYALDGAVLLQPAVVEEGKAA